jgi:hypothetical protein
LGTGLQTIGEQAFFNNQLVSLNIPNSVTTIGNGAFMFGLLTSVSIPAGVTTLGQFAFLFNNLASVTFAGNAPPETAGVFDGNNNLTQLNVTAGTTGWGANWSGFPTNVTETFTYTTDGNNNVTVTGCVNTCPANIEIPATLGGNPVVRVDAFANMPLIETAIIPASVTYLGDSFANGAALESVVFLGDLPTFGMYAFYNTAKLPYLQVLTSAMGWGATANNKRVVVSDFFHTTDVNNNVTVTGCIGACPTSLIIPSTIDGNPVTVIGDLAFAYQNIITSVSMPASLISIGNGAFQVNQLATVSIPASVTEIKALAFNSNLLTSVTFLGNAPQAGLEVFKANAGLNGVTAYVGGTSGWGATLSGVPVEFLTYTTDSSNNVSVTGCVGTCPANLVVPATLGGNPVTTIGGQAFMNNATITSVTLPNSLLVVGVQAFQGVAITKLDLGSSVQSIMTSAFFGNQLKSVTIPASMQFRYCGQGHAYNLFTTC